MDIEFLAKGFIIGLSVAAPVGPIGVLCIRRTLANGRASGLLTGLGAATADAAYGAVAAFGLTALVDQGTSLRVIGGSFLVYLGARSFASRPAERDAVAKRADLARDYVSSLGLTLTNPTTILSFAAIFAGLGLADVDAGYGSAAVMVSRRAGRLGVVVVLLERGREPAAIAAGPLSLAREQAVRPGYRRLRCCSAHQRSVGILISDSSLTE